MMTFAAFVFGVILGLIAAELVLKWMRERREHDTY